MKVLVVVDVQNDFVTGALGTPEAQAMLPKLVDKVKGFDGEVWFTKDTHEPDYLSTQEGKYLPVEHCIKGTAGWEFAPELEVLIGSMGEKARVFEKPTFGSVKLADALSELRSSGELESVELVGICTDICVVSNALLIKANMPELPVLVDGSCCAGVTPEKHSAALEVMASCQVQMV